MWYRGLNEYAWQCPTFTRGDPALSSALNVFTSEFGMDSGGSHSLWPPGKLFAPTEMVRILAVILEAIPPYEPVFLGVI